jgi:hypothetical protein
LRGGIDVQIRQRIGHRIKVAGLPGQVKEEAASFDQGGHGMHVPNICKINSNPVADVVNIEEIAAILRDQAINECYFCPKGHQSASQRRADEAEPACYENVRTGKSFVIERHGSDSRSRPKRLSTTFRGFFARICQICSWRYNIHEFAQGAGKYISHGKLLAPTWTAVASYRFSFPT